MKKEKTYAEILTELEAATTALAETGRRLEEANETLEAIREGEIDALVVKAGGGHQLYTLKSADQTYRIFIEQMTEGVVTLSTENTILYCNSSFAALVQQPLEKVMGQPFFDYFSGPQREQCIRLIEKAWTHTTRGELNLTNGNGKEIPVLLSCKRLDLEESRSLNIILTNLTAQKEYQQVLLEKNAQLESAEKTARYLNANLENLVRERTSELERTIEEKIRIGDALKENQERLSQILETMAEAVVIMDLEGKMMYANPMAQNLLDMHTDPAEGYPYRTAAQSLTLDGLPLQWEQHPMHISMIIGKPIFDTEIGIALPGKDRFYILVNAAPIFDGDNRVSGSIGTFMDVTKRRIAIQQKDDFIGVASHELKTPITVLKTSIQLLDKLKGNLTHQMVPGLIEQANKGLTKLGTLVEDLLDVSRMKEGQLSLNRKNFVLDDMISDSIAHLQPDKRSRVIIRGERKLEINGDPHRIEQVVVNLINNALKYAPGSKQIVIDIAKETDAVKISVTDDGPGIATEKQSHLFDRYYRTDYSVTMSSGLGLGLYISAEIVKKHNGSIGVDSRPGQGSSFWFTLPLTHT